MARLTVALALPAEELGPVERELALAGYDVVPVATPEEFATLLDSRREFALAVLDGESDFDKSIEFYSLLHENGRDIPALMVVSPRALAQLSGATNRASINDEYFTRPYSADSLRWRVEAMLIRSQTVDDGKGPIIESDQGISTTGGGPKRATIVAVFNSQGRRRQDDHLDEPGDDPPGPARAAGPAGRRRYGHRPHRQLARARPGQDGRRRLGGRPPRGGRATDAGS